MGRSLRVVAVLGLAFGAAAAIQGCGALLGVVDGTGTGLPDAGAGPGDGGSGGGSGGGGTTEDREAPTIANVAVDPTTLRFTGGQVAVSAEVSDPGGVARAWVAVTGPDQATQETELAAGAGQSFSGTLAIAPNTEVGASRAYAIRVHARDNAGNAGVGDPSTVTVESPPGPPAGPPPL